MVDELIIDKEINLKGEVCPYTFVKSKLAIEEMEPGAILRVIVDYFPATKNIPRSMEYEGNKVLKVSPINGTDWEIIVQKE
jgi:TusA-related sulfurtransferase